MKNHSFGSQNSAKTPPHHPSGTPLNTDFSTNPWVDLVRVQSALWGLGPDGNHATHESLSVVTLKGFTPERTLEKTAQALVERAQSNSITLHRALLNRPFYRLSHLERFILVSLHQNKWSYARLARITRMMPLEIEQIAWGARMRLGASPEIIKNPPKWTGTRMRGLTCPDLNTEAPWTQKLLDQECSAQEKFYLQEHMRLCAHCSDHMTHAKDLYYLVESLIPHDPDQSVLNQSAQDLEFTWKETVRTLSKNPNFWPSLERFWSQHRDIRILTYLLLAWTFYQFIF